MLGVLGLHAILVASTLLICTDAEPAFGKKAKNRSEGEDVAVAVTCVAKSAVPFNVVQFIVPHVSTPDPAIPFPIVRVAVLASHIS
jgi:hypothetical protein